jgi:hypothetical protein
MGLDIMVEEMQLTGSLYRIPLAPYTGYNH